MSERRGERPRKGCVERRQRAVVGISLERRSEGAGEVLHFSGIASATGRPYEVGFYTETIEPGSFRRTLNNTALDVQLLVNHTGLPLARTTSRTLTLREVREGLLVEADLDPTDPDVQALEPKMRRGDVTEMSFAFRAVEEEWPDDTTRILRQVDIHRGDVSVVSYGANPASTAELRAAHERALRELDLRLAKTRLELRRLRQDAQSRRARYRREAEDRRMRDERRALERRRAA